MDDVATAKADTISFGEREAQGGASDENLPNVLANDQFGADDTVSTHMVAGVSAGVQTGELASGTGTAVEGEYGYLTLKADGTYTYTLKTNPETGKPIDITSDVQDVFSYTIKDSDGDWSTTTITVNVSADTQKPSVTIPTVGSDATTVYESSLDESADQPAGSDSGSSNDRTSGEIKLALNGESGTLTIGGKTIELDATGTATNLTESNNTITTDHGTLTITSIANGTVKYEYQLDGAQEHAAVQGANELKDEIAISVTDQTGDTADGTLTITIVDDIPTISNSDMVTSVFPGDSGDNLADGTKFSFTTGDREKDQLLAGQTISQGTELDGWDGVKMYAGKVTYTTDDKGNTVIKENGLDIDARYELQYSTYPNSNEKPASDWGLMVSSPDDAQAWEINVSKDGKTSEAVVFDLGGKLAYGVTIDFGAFYLGGEDAQYDHVSEEALVTFYRDGQIVGSTLVYGQSSNGKYTLNSSDVVLGGFDKVVISAVDNKTPDYRDELSDFTIQGIDFITKSEDPIIVSDGTVTAESGADGFADDYENSYVHFDLEGMVGGKLNEDGTGTITVLVDGNPQTVKLELNEGSSGESILIGTMSDGKQLFTATLDKDGHWTMEQYQQFRVPGEDGQESNTFELIFKTEDADGDIASTTVDVPLEIVEQQVNSDNAVIGNGNDTIVIMDSEGVAGTVAAGDTGGMVEGQQVEANYNVCFILDKSKSMNENIGNFGSPTRAEAARDSILNFIGGIADTDFTGSVTISIIPFAERAGDSIEISITKNAEGVTYRYNGWSYTSFEEGWNSLHDQLANAMDGASVGSNIVTDYEPAFEAAADWYDSLASSVENATKNITYFLTDGRPAGEGTDNAYKDDYERAWEAYNKLLNSLGDSNNDIHAIGFGSDLSETDMENLAMFDNTPKAEGDASVASGGFAAADGVYAPESGQTTYEKVDAANIDTQKSYYVQDNGAWHLVTYENVGQWWSHWEWGYTNNYGQWQETPFSGNDRYDFYEVAINSTISGGTSQQVTDSDSLTAAFENGFKPGDLVDAGSDTITAESSTSSGIIYGDVMNTDALRYELANSGIDTALIATLPDYGSGSAVFQWLENNASSLTGTEFAGWTHDDTVKYMLEHHEELGYETVIQTTEEGQTNFFLVDLDGNVLNMNGTAANVAADSLTGRGGGDDTIIGSEAGDIMFGQEGNDLMFGDGHSGSGADQTSVHDTVTKALGLDEGAGAELIADTIEGLNTGELSDFISKVEGTDSDGSDHLFGGSGDDVIFGMGGDDYIVGGAGEDIVFAGSGNDIIVYDGNDYLIDGGSGLDVMLGDSGTPSLNDLLGQTQKEDGKPLVNDVEVLIRGDNLSLTSMEDLSKLGITITHEENGSDRIELGEDWKPTTTGTENGIVSYTNGGLTVEIDTSVMTQPSDAEVQQAVFILNNTQG